MKYKLTFKGLDKSPEENLKEWMIHNDYHPVDWDTYPIVEFKLRPAPYSAPVESIYYVVDFKKKTVHRKVVKHVPTESIKIEEPFYSASEEFRKMGFKGVNEHDEDMYSSWNQYTDNLYEFFGYDTIEMGEYYKFIESENIYHVIELQPHLKLVEKFESDGDRHNNGKLKVVAYVPFTKEELKYFDLRDFDFTQRYKDSIEQDITDWFGDRT